DAIAELGRQILIALPVAPDRVAELAIPLPERAGEIADLVAAHPGVPRLGDQLDAGQDRVLLHDLEDRRLAIVGPAPDATDHAREVEAEAVDVHLVDPVTQ